MTTVSRSAALHTRTEPCIENFAASRRTILLVDAAKFAMHGSARVCGPEALDAVVTDAPSDWRVVARLADRGVEVIHA